MTTSTIPVLDLQRFESADPTVAAGAARELDDICREIGFLVISNHGVSETRPAGPVRCRARLLRPGARMRR